MLQLLFLGHASFVRAIDVKGYKIQCHATEINFQIIEEYDKNKGWEGTN